MTALRTPARTPGASGLSFLGLFVWVLAIEACGSAGAPPGREAPAGPGEPPIEAGTTSPAAEAAAARLLREAEDAFGAGAWSRALDASREVARAYPRTAGSTRALRLGALAAFEIGRLAAADSLAGRYLEVVPEGRGLRAPMVLVRGRALLALNDPEGAVRTLLGLPPDAPDSARTGALAAIREGVDRAGTAVLRQIVSNPAFEGPLLAPLLAELAVAEHFEGDEERARGYARRVLDLGRDSQERELARAVLEGRLEDVLGAAPAMGALLPTGGSPGLARVAELVGEGARVATEQAEARRRRPVRLRILEDSGTPDGEVARYRELESEGVVGVIGPLLDRSLETVARARGRPVPLVSPTAQSVPPELDGVYSLNGPDPDQARVLARYALRAGFRTAAVVFSTARTSTVEARTFADAFRSGGGSVLAELPYDSGATYFESQFLRVAELRPEAVVLPVPARDLELLAPQVSFFALDTLNIRILGTSGWTSDAVLGAVEPRHTDSVVAVAARAPGRGDSAWLSFVESYESRYHKSLRSPVPALGYDAAGLLLEALDRGARTPQDLRRTLESIRGFEGATGILSVEQGRIVREWFPVLIHDRRPDPIPSDGVPPIGPLPPPPPPPDTADGGSRGAPRPPRRPVLRPPRG